VPVASSAGAICIDKLSAYRLGDGYPLVMPEVTANRAPEALERDRIVANPRVELQQHRSLRSRPVQTP